MNRQDTVLIGIVSATILASIIFVLITIPVPEPESVVKQTWYFFPGECWLIEPEDTRICYFTDECGWGRFAKSVKGHGMVDNSELWKLQQNMVEINFTKCNDR